MNIEATMRHLKNLCALTGISGREDAVRDYLRAAVEAAPAQTTVTTDALGNLLVQVTGARRAARKLLFAAHMDEVGFLVTGITDEGYLRFTPVGGVDAAVVYGRRVLVNGLPGVIGGKAKHLCSEDEQKNVPAFSKLLIDIGAADRAQAETLVRPGDAAVFDSEWTALEGGRFKARALDDRAGCALLLSLLEETPPVDLTLAFTVQEEIGLRGAKTAAYAMQPDVAVVVDATTAADTVGVAADKQVCRVGGGAVVSFMDNRTLYDKALYDTILDAAAREGIKAQPKTMVAGGNDAGAIQLAGRGARVAAVSLPCRYIHSPSCVLAEEDIAQTQALLRVLARELAV